VAPNHHMQPTRLRLCLGARLMRAARRSIVDSELQEVASHA
jgi:hypothetical protein